MMELMFADGSGGKIEWCWKRCSLRVFYADYPHLDREQDPGFWLAVNVGLAFAYATVIAFAASRALRATEQKN